MIPVWYVPSFYGDIRLARAVDPEQTVLVAEKMTPREQEALVAFLDDAGKKGWMPGVEPGVVPDRYGSASYNLTAPLEKVSRALARKLKPDRTIVSAVKFADGSMQEYQEKTPEPELPKATAKKKKPKAAASVAAPHRGCPAPDFPNAELKARLVLERFLVAEQIEDFRRYNRFIATGATTGHRYMITSRHARDSLATYQRTLFDLDDGHPLCVHDWSVPAAEEMLALHLLLQLPGWENYLRHLE